MTGYTLQSGRATDTYTVRCCICLKMSYVQSDLSHREVRPYLICSEACYRRYYKRIKAFALKALKRFNAPEHIVRKVKHDAIDNIVDDHIGKVINRWLQECNDMP